MGLLFSLALVKGVHDIFKTAYSRLTFRQADGIVTKVSREGWRDEKRKMRYYLEYEYEANGILHRNVRYLPGEDSLKGLMGIKEYRDLVSSSKEGNRLGLYYDPSRPEVAYLSLDYLRNDFLFSGLVIGFLVMVGTMVQKESHWKRVIRRVSATVSEHDAGKQALPPINELVKDSGRSLNLETSMSVFWYLGIPFFAASLGGAASMASFVNAVNPGWSLSHYIAIVGAIWGTGLAAGLIVRKCRHRLEIDAERREVREIRTRLFGKKTAKHDFAQIESIALYLQKGALTRGIPQWVMYLQMKEGGPLFISYRHRDKQPADPIYLGIVKRRIEQLVFGTSG
jgi:hypothetical protein